MSKTAGLGSGDYAAVSATAVTALVIGLGGGLALLHPVLLLLPLTGVILAILSLRRIAQSAATQTGRKLAWAGLVLSGIFIVLAGGSALSQQMRYNNDTRRIALLIDQMWRDVSVEKWDAAYGRFSDTFRSRVDKAEFIRRWQAMQNTPMYGSLKSLKWNGTPPVIETDPTLKARVGKALMEAQFQGGNPGNYDIVIKYSQQNWVVEDIPGIFPPPLPQRGAGKIIPNS